MESGSGKYEGKNLATHRGFPLLVVLLRFLLELLSPKGRAAVVTSVRPIRGWHGEQRNGGPFIVALCFRLQLYLMLLQQQQKKINQTKKQLNSHVKSNVVLK